MKESLFLQIILVDDEDFFLNYLEFLIQGVSEAYQVVAKASSGLEALAILEIVYPDLIITDIKMPEMDGITMLKCAKERGWRGKSVVVSGYDDFTLVQEALRSDVQDYLLKPVTEEDISKLFSRIEKIIISESSTQQRLEETIRKQIMEEFIPFPDHGDCSLPDYVAGTLEIIQERYQEKITLCEIAEEVNVTPAYLSYSFRKYTGQTIVEYINKLRIEVSKCLLINSDLQIKEVAERVGYEDAKYFSRVFHRIVGCSPTTYRRNTKKCY
ncbi:MAG: helix-turn-helix domain-containing protein [Atribacterota bacterium]|nr:helix-turn-helix domain-containing protein [Atribacterota bacterium]HQE25592.1 helix-turn-helix domain-containing protein [Candidatus Atribacteria bacterium]